MIWSNAHNDATYINGTPIFKLYMARLVVENGPKKKSVTMRLDFVLFLFYFDLYRFENYHDREDICDH